MHIINFFVSKISHRMYFLKENVFLFGDLLVTVLVLQNTLFEVMCQSVRCDYKNNLSSMRIVYVRACVFAVVFRLQKKETKEKATENSLQERRKRKKTLPVLFITRSHYSGAAGNQPRPTFPWVSPRCHFWRACWSSPWKRRSACPW